MRCDYYSRGYSHPSNCGRPVTADEEDRCPADARRYVLVHGPGQRDVPLALCDFHNQDDFNLRGCRAEDLTADEYRALDVLFE